MRQQRWVDDFLLPILLVFYGFSFLLYLACLVPRFPDVEVNPGPRAGAPRKYWLMIANINGLSANLNELSVAASRFGIILCAETLVAARRHASEFLVPGFGRPALSLRDVRPGARGLALYVRKKFPAFRRAEYECTCCEMMVVRVCGFRQKKIYLFEAYRNLSTDDRIFDCFLSSIAFIQSEDSRVAFCFMGDFNCHHEKWLGSCCTNSHGRSARDFSDMADCRQMVVDPTHRDGGVLDLVLTDVPDLCEVVTGCSLGRSDHC